MKIVDGKTSDIRLSYDIEKETQGIVVRNRDDTKKNSLGLYIPRYMLGIDISEGPKKKSLSLKTDKIVNSVNKDIGKSNISCQNYIDVPCYLIGNMSMPRFEYGEHVVVTMADGDIKNLTFYPYSQQDTRMRATDVVRNYVPAKKNKNDDIDDDNSYFTEYNSRDKFVKFHTSKANGEKCEFNILADTKEGILKVWDDKDKKRSFEWNYNEDSLTTKTDGGIIMELKKAKVYFECEDYEIKAKNSIVFETSSYKLKADKGDVEVTSYKKKTTSYENTGQTYKTEYPTTEMKGINWNTTFTQALHTIPAFSVTGVVLASGMAFGAAPGAFPAPPLSPGGKAAGPSSMMDVAGLGMGMPVAFAAPVITALNAIAAVADKALGIAMWHEHPGFYKPLLFDPTLCVPVVPKPPSLSMTISSGIVASQTPSIPAIRLKG